MEGIYDKYAPAVYGIIYRILHDKHSAEECLLATFLKAWNDSATIRNSDVSLFTCLLQIARKIALEEKAKLTKNNPGIQNSVYRPEKTDTSFELIYNKGLSLEGAAALSGITVGELKRNLRTDLQQRSVKKKKA